jgi:putative SOS response-associated peptidase YedK
MCGRFVSAQSPDRVAEFFGASFDAPTLPANFNVAPTNDVYAIAHGVQRPQLTTFHWGLVPSWAKDTKIASKMINARAETLAQKPAFKGLFAKHRLIIPMDGFYEWQTVPAAAEGKPTKRPLLIYHPGGEPLAVAGLWARWRPKQAEQTEGAPWLHTCTIITTRANETMAPVHDRMPVLLPRSAWDEWLDPTNRDIASLAKLLVPAPNDVLTMHEVSTLVNNVRNKGAELIEPA